MLKINVLTVKLTVHILIDPANAESRERAGNSAEDLIGHANLIGDVGTVETRLNRIYAPEPDMPFPEELEPPESKLVMTNPEEPDEAPEPEYPEDARADLSGVRSRGR